LTLPGGLVVTGVGPGDKARGGPGDAPTSALMLNPKTSRYDSVVGSYAEIWPAPRGTLAAVRDDGHPDQIGIYDLNTRKVTWQAVGKYVLTPQWAPEGRRLLISRDAGFAVLDTERQNKVTDFVPKPAIGCTDWCRYTWLPDGATVALPVSDPTSAHSEAAPHLRKGLQLLQSRDGAALGLAPARGNVAGPQAWSPDGTLVIVAGQQGDQVVRIDTGEALATLSDTGPGFQDDPSVHFVNNDRLLRIIGNDAVLTTLDGRTLERRHLPAGLDGRQLTIAQP
jgi:dipeptidyl aminopeptidase/acylaminoacyl peptidase